MRIYLSIASKYSFARVHSLESVLSLKHQVTKYIGGKYDIQPVLEANVCLILIKPNQDHLGRGQYSELNEAALAGNICRCIEVKDNDSFILYEIEDCQEIKEDWKYNYATVETSNPIEVTKEELNKRIEQLIN